MTSMVSERLRPTGNWFETIVGALVILIALAFLVFMYGRTGTGHLGSYSLVVRMPSAAGLGVGKDVRVGGVKVGSILRLSLAPADYSAVVEIAVRDDLFFPADSTVGITTTPMGGVYLVINPGHATRTIPPGGTLEPPAAKGAAPAAGT